MSFLRKITPDELSMYGSSTPVTSQEEVIKSSRELKDLILVVTVSFITASAENGVIMTPEQQRLAMEAIGFAFIQLDGYYDAMEKFKSPSAGVH